MSFQDCKTKVHSVCENHNGIWKNCVDQPRFQKIIIIPLNLFLKLSLCQGGVYREASHKGDQEMCKGWSKMGYA